jgi:hypothetical protein
MREEDVAGEGAAPEPQPGTLAALLTASLSAKLAEAVSELVGAVYAARIERIEPKAHGGAAMLVAFLPRPPAHTVTIALGEETIELPLPPGVVDEPTS